MNTSAPRHTEQAPPVPLPDDLLDVAVAGTAPRGTAPLRSTLIAVVAMPLFFLVSFTLAYVSATHAPVPNGVEVLLVGDTAVTGPLADAIAAESEAAFDVTTTASADAARTAVATREADGALVVDNGSVSVIEASGGGTLLAATVRQLGDRVAAELDAGAATVSDVAPLPADDPSGTALFFFFVVCTVPPFLSISVANGLFQRRRTRAALAAGTATALLAPVLGFSVISLFVDFEVPFGGIASLLGVGMLYSLTVALLSSWVTRLLGAPSLFVLVLVVFVLNLPSAGGTAPAAMLPDFWQGVHTVWIGSGAFEQMRNIVFFGGAGSSHWLGQLLIWTGANVVLFAVVSAALRRRERRADGTGAPASSTKPETPRQEAAAPAVG